jgi:hypothetical protein
MKRVSLALHRGKELASPSSWTATCAERLLSSTHGRMTEILLGCRVHSVEASNEEEDESLLRKVDLTPLKIIFNGIDNNPRPIAAPPS